jgi:hypothetical protein
MIHMVLGLVVVMAKNFLCLKDSFQATTHINVIKNFTDHPMLLLRRKKN